MLKQAGRVVLILLALAGLAALAVALRLAAGGIESRSTPGAVETAVARRLRSFGIPAAAKNQMNPVAVTQEVVDEGMAHFADHCASCHANDGSGDTDMGKGLYPKPPDMRREETQAL